MKSYYCMYIVDDVEADLWVLATSTKEAYNIVIKELIKITGLESLLVKQLEQFNAY